MGLSRTVQFLSWTGQVRLRLAEDGEGEGGGESTGVVARSLARASESRAVL